MITKKQNKILVKRIKRAKNPLLRQILCLILGFGSFLPKSSVEDVLAEKEYFEDCFELLNEKNMQKFIDINTLIIYIISIMKKKSNARTTDSK